MAQFESHQRCLFRWLETDLLSNRVSVFEKFARGVPSYRPDDVKLIRRCADEPFVLSLVPEEPTWDVPHRLLSAVQYLILSGEAPDYRESADQWATFIDILHAHRQWVADFIHHQGIQTNETQRCFALLPLFLTVARATGKPLDLLELGTSAGLNLLWDRYRYQYREGPWGSTDAVLELTGEEECPVPGGLLKQEIAVGRRRGIDLQPVDVTTELGFRLLASFLGSDSVRLERLRRAAVIASHHPLELIQGNYLEMLPVLLRDRSDSAVTVVFQTLSTIYLPIEERLGLRAVVERAGADGPLAWISTPDGFRL